MSGSGIYTAVTYTWPSDLPTPVLPLADEFDMPVIESTKEMGVRQTRPKYTDEDNRLFLFWPVLTDTHKLDILTFFREIGWGGTIFEFPHPHTEDIINVRLVGKVRFEARGASLWMLSLQLEKANIG